MNRPATVGLLAVLAAGALLPSTAVASPVAAAATRCDGAHRVPASASPAKARVAVMCLINRYRWAHRRRPLRFNPQLNRAAHSYSLRMVNDRFFGHTAPGGGTMVDRLRHAGYIRSGGTWTVGENLGWGTTALATPAHIVAGWANSPGHRRNMLRAAYREAGIGVVPVAPSGAPGGTYTIEFGARR